MAEATLRMEGGIAGFAVRLGHRGSSGGSEGLPRRLDTERAGTWRRLAMQAKHRGRYNLRRGIYRAGLGSMSRLAI
jgi:hypothetical protein